jgi:hypothetical protein
MSQENTTERTPESGLSSHDLFSRALRAICLTRDYVGEKLLPAVEGWEWYDAGRALAEAIPEDEWAEQFRLRTQTRRGCVCQLCGKSAQEIGGYLARVNEKGIPGIWECRPDCNTAMEPDDRVMAAINGENAEVSRGDGSATPTTQKS